MRVLSGLLLIVFLAAVAVFAAQNRGLVDILVLDSVFRLPLALVVVGSYLLGMLSGWSVVGMVRRSWRQVREADGGR
jgi:uncharacterized integral membrane protein